jgi:zinc/manganese transport system substrate-binding protein
VPLRHEGELACLSAAPEVEAMRSSIRILAIAVIAVVAAAAIGYAVYTSQLPAPATCPSSTTVAAKPGPAATRGPAVPATHGSVDPTRALASASRLADGAVFPGTAAPMTGSGAVVKVVAAENFWGSLVGQLGGNDTSVVSVVSDPNADPHEYEANVTDATLVANAQLVVVNGVGYDQWALNLIQAANTPGQVVLNVGDLNGVVLGGGIVAGNPHMWYNPTDVNRTVAAMYSDLAKIAPGDTATFQANYAALNVSLGALYGQAGAIKSKFAGTKVAATEDIFVYLANYTGLDLVSPPEFMQAVAEGSDPPAQSIVTFQCQLESGQVRVLVYNQQTITPVTTNLKAIAAANNVTIVGVTETIQPPGVTFEVWMNAEYLALENALNAGALGH